MADLPLLKLLTSCVILVNAGLRILMGARAVSLSKVTNCGQLGPASVSAWSLFWNAPSTKSGVTIVVFSKVHCAREPGATHHW